MKTDFKNYPVTSALVVLVVGVYAVMTLRFDISINNEEALRMGGFNPLFVLYNHEYYRMITANFIHFGLSHIFFNTYALCNLGCLMERILHTKNYCIVLVVSMLSTTGIGLVLYLMFGIGIYTVSGGISGVIFGLIGSLMALSFLYKDIYSYLFRQLKSSLILMLILSVAVPSISLTGHVGGLIGGFVATIVIEKMKSKKQYIYH